MPLTATEIAYQLFVAVVDWYSDHANASFVVHRHHRFACTQKRVLPVVESLPSPQGRAAEDDGADSSPVALYTVTRRLPTRATVIDRLPLASQPSSANEASDRREQRQPHELRAEHHRH
jgi:hypothetical protein